MQPLHRSTLWRRGQKPPSHLGRKRGDAAEDEFNLDLLAKMLVWLARSGGSAGYPGGRMFVPMNEVSAVESKRDIKLARKHIAMNWQCDEMAIPCGLLIVGAWDAFHVDTRRRGRSYNAKTAGELSPRERLAVAQIVRTGVEKDEAERMVRQAVSKREPWIAEFMRGDADEPMGWSRASCNVPCPSRFFRISRRMVSYWRRNAETRALLALEMTTVARHYLRDDMGLKVTA
jgi:hypothetical protein